jgi:hypothetical protein
MMMADDLNATAAVDGTMPVMKMESIGLEGIAHFDLAAELPIMVASHDHDLAVLREFAEKRSGFACRCLVVNQIAENDEALRFVFRDQFRESVGDRCHAPQWDERAGCALAQFVTKMQVRHRQPAFGLMEKRESSIENNFIGDERLVRA